MSGTVLDEIRELPEGEPELPAPDPALAGEGDEGFSWDRVVEILKTETGPGELTEYQTHPLNWNGSTAAARILRGATGFFGSLRLALVDIGFGILELAWPKKLPAQPPDVPGA